jgi:hypothetical protein
VLHISLRERESATWGWSSGLVPKGDKRVNILESREVRVGTTVGVLDGARRAGKGRIGTIEKTYGHPDYLAVDVRFDDGSDELYWYYELRTSEPQRPL